MTPEVTSLADLASVQPAPAARRLKLWPLALVAVAALVAALFAWHHFSGIESTDDAQIDGHINPVAAQVAGTVAAIKVKDNESVHAGDVLAEIDRRPFDVALARARADLAGAEADASEARTQLPMTDTVASNELQASTSDVETAKARLLAAQARLAEAHANDVKESQDLTRLKELVAKDEVSRQEYDAALAEAAAARAALATAEAQVTEARQGVDGAQAHRAQASTAPQKIEMARARAASAKAKVDGARAAVDQAQLDLDHCTLAAPIDGIVSRRTVEVGQVVQPGQPFMAIVPTADLWVTANFKESQLANMRAGQPVLVKVDAYGGRRYTGHVDSIAAATGARFSLLPPENATGNFVKVVQRIPVKIALDPGQDDEHMLRPGMSVVPSVMTR